MKHIVPFVIKTTILFQLGIEDSTCLRNLNLNLNHFLQPSTNILNILFNKQNNQTARYRSRSKGNHYRRFSRNSRYKSNFHSRSNSRSEYYHNHPSHNYSSTYDRSRSRYDQYYKNSSSRPYYSSRSNHYSTSSCSPYKFYLRSRERSSSYYNSLLDAINHHIAPLLSHVMTATAVALTLIQNHTQIINTNTLLTTLNNLHLLFSHHSFSPLFLESFFRQSFNCQSLPIVPLLFQKPHGT